MDSFSSSSSLIYKSYRWYRARVLTLVLLKMSVNSWYLDSIADKLTKLLIALASLLTRSVE